VFLDLGMPGMDGYDTARALRRLPGLALVWIVALSGWNDQQTLARTVSAGFDHHLNKPADFALIDTVLSADLVRTGLAPLRGRASQL
jgi:CheY-like chemotaxis protein